MWGGPVSTRVEAQAKAAGGGGALELAVLADARDGHKVSRAELRIVPGQQRRPLPGRHRRCCACVMGKPDPSAVHPVDCTIDSPPLLLSLCMSGRKGHVLYPRLRSLEGAQCCSYHQCTAQTRLKPQTALTLPLAERSIDTTHMSQPQAAPQASAVIAPRGRAFLHAGAAVRCGEHGMALYRASSDKKRWRPPSTELVP